MVCRQRQFQSRNRESFGFYYLCFAIQACLLLMCFNLVIESLLVSTGIRIPAGTARNKFQSRNRESFGFYESKDLQTMNYIIKLQFQSRNRESFGFYTSLAVTDNRGIRFQSRNRESFGFYLTQQFARRPIEPVSIS